MELFSKLRQMLSSAPPTPEPSAVSPAQSAWTRQLKPPASISLNTDDRRSASYLEMERTQQQYREELGKSMSVAADQVMKQIMQAYTLALTPEQCTILDRFNLEYAHSTQFDWALFNKHTPESFREAYPELYI